MGKPKSSYGLAPELSEDRQMQQAVGKASYALGIGDKDFHKSTDGREHLSDSQREICRLALGGLKQCEIAEEMGVSQGQVTHVLKIPVVSQHLADLQKDKDARYLAVRERIERLSVDAVAVAEEIMKNGEVKADTRLKAASGFLDRAGHGAVKETRTVGVNMKVNVLEMLRERGKAVNAMQEKFAEYEQESNPEQEEKEDEAP